MSKEAPQEGVEIIERVADGSVGTVELDKGGNWSKDHGVWVDNRFKEFVVGLEPGEQAMIETFANIALATAVVFNRQVKDAEEGLMWPENIFKEDGEAILHQVIEWEEEGKLNIGLSDPYSTFGPNGFDWEAMPYSSAYHEELRPLRDQLEDLLNNPNAEPYNEYVATLLAAYEHQPTKGSDFDDMRQADIAWLTIPSDATLLFMAEPTEIYLDRARATLGQDPKIAGWADTVEKSQGLPPWRTFMEFRLLVKDESMVTEEDVTAIRQTSRELFASTEDQEVPVSLEFRRLLIASGNGANPAKTAKNYPNQADIREQIGYKNIIYTNMVEMGARDLLGPSLEAAFGEQVVNEIGMEQLIKGSVLRIVGHEENHPFKRFTDTPIEEMKATVNGIKAIVEAGFSKADVNSTILTSVGAGLHIRTRVNRARAIKDEITERKYEAYYKADTMMMNALWAGETFLLDTLGQVVGIDYEKAVEAIMNFTGELDAIRGGNAAETVPQLYEKYGSEDVWNSFSVLE